MLCVYDIDYPLPYRWRISLDREEQRKERYTKAVKVLTQIAEDEEEPGNVGASDWLHAKRKSSQAEHTTPPGPVKLPNNVTTFAQMLMKIKSEEQLTSKPARYERARRAPREDVAAPARGEETAGLHCREEEARQARGGRRRKRR